MGTLNNTNKLPECPNYVAHPQSVWFEEHWRPALAAKNAEIERLKEIISYLPKVPTQPYEKELAKRVLDLQNELAEKDAVLDELADLMEEVRSGNYKPDTFTLQP